MEKCSSRNKFSLTAPLHVHDQEYIRNCEIGLCCEKRIDSDINTKKIFN